MSPPALRKNGAPMGTDLDQYCWDPNPCKGNSMDERKNLKRFIEELMLKEFLKNIVANKRVCSICHMDRYALLEKGQDAPRAKRGI